MYTYVATDLECDDVIHGRLVEDGADGADLQRVVGVVNSQLLVVPLVTVEVVRAVITARLTHHQRFCAQHDVTPQCIDDLYTAFRLLFTVTS